MTHDEVQLGAILRIADATEAIARRHTELIDECDRLDGVLKHEQVWRKSVERRLAAAKGTITKLKRRLAKIQVRADAYSGEEETHA